MSLPCIHGLGLELVWSAQIVEGALHVDVSSHFNPFHPSLFSFLLFFSLCLTESYTCHSRAFQLRLCERRELRPVDVLLGDVLTERDHLEADVLTLSVTIQP